MTRLSSQMLAALPADVIRRRPDIRAAERLVGAAAANIGIAEAALYPSLRLSGQGGYTSTQFDRLVMPSNLGGLLAIYAAKQLGNCGTWFTDAIWWDKDNFDAYQSFRFDSQLTSVLDWVVHDVPTTINPSASPLTDRQYYITDLGGSYNHEDDAPFSTAQFVELPPDLAIFGAEITHTWEATFTK